MCQVRRRPLADRLSKGKNKSGDVSRTDTFKASWNQCSEKCNSGSLVLLAEATVLWRRLDHCGKTSHILCPNNQHVLVSLPENEENCGNFMKKKQIAMISAFTPSAAVSAHIWLMPLALPTWIWGHDCILLCRSSQLRQAGWGHSQVSRDACLGSFSVVAETTPNARCVFRVIVLLECDPSAQSGILAAVQHLIKYTPHPDPHPLQPWPVCPCSCPPQCCPTTMHCRVGTEQIMSSACCPQLLELKKISAAGRVDLLEACAQGNPGPQSDPWFFGHVWQASVIVH